jgi:hypothetical protein
LATVKDGFERQRLVGAPLRLDGLDRAVDDQQVEPRVAFVVEPGGTEPGEQQRPPAQAARERCVVEQLASEVAVQSNPLAAEVVHHQVVAAVTVVVAGVDPHAGLRVAVRRQRAPGEQRHLLERAVMLVDPQLVAGPVVGDVEVGPAIAVEVVGHDAQRGTVHRAEAGTRRNVLEGAVAAVVEEAPGHRVGLHRGAPAGLPGGGVASLVGGIAEADVVAHVEVQPAVAVVVEERGADCPVRVGGAALLGHVGEGAVAVVVPQLRPAQAGQVDVGEAVVVEVAHRDSHAIAGGPDAALLGDVGEPELALAVRSDAEVVVEEPRALQRVRLRVRPQRSALHQEDVHPAVVVVVDQGRAGAHDLGHIELAGHAVVVGEDQPALGGTVGEDRNLRGSEPRGRRGCRCRGCRRGRQGGRGEQQGAAQPRHRRRGAGETPRACRAGGSATSSSRLPAIGPAIVCTRPDGHRTSILSAAAASPSPK